MFEVYVDEPTLQLLSQTGRAVAGSRDGFGDDNNLVAHCDAGDRLLDEGMRSVSSGLAGESLSIGLRQPIVLV